MSVLLIDIGNTRLKWAKLTGSRLTRATAAGHGKWRASDYAAKLTAGKPERALIASVAGPAMDRTLAAALRKRGLRVSFVRVTRRLAGVTVGYREPWRLGVDRFVALIGAHALFPGVNVCVAGVGTALTLDLLHASGRHAGGAIIPAPELMVQTLLKETHGIRRRAREAPHHRSDLFARSTRDAIEQGARFAAAALIDRALEYAALRLGQAPLLILSGGGARELRPLISSRCVGIADLTLRGLAVLANL